MNTDFRLSAGYFEHPKIQRLSRKLGDSGVLSHIRLLRFVAVNRPDGDLHGMDALDVALAGGYSGDEAVFLSVLLETHLLDKGEGDALSVHDWIDHNDYAATAPQRKAKASAAASARWGKPDSQAPSSSPSAEPPVPASPKPKRASAPKPDDIPAPSDASLPFEQCSEHDLALLNTSLGNAPTSLPTFLPTEPTVPTTTTLLPPLGPSTPNGGCPEPDAGVVVASLRDFGISDSIAEELVRVKGAEACQRQAKYLPWRIKERETTAKPVRDPAALLVKAIQDGYAPPVTFSQAQTRKAEEAERRELASQRTQEAASRAEAERQTKEAGQEKLEASLDQLPLEKREEVTQEATDRFRKQYPVHARKLDKVDGDPLRLPPGPKLHWEALRGAVLVERGLVSADASP